MSFEKGKIIETLDHIDYSRDGFKPFVKSPVIWASDGHAATPLCYLRKPKHLSEVDWNKFLDCFEFEINRAKLEEK